MTTQEKNKLIAEFMGFVNTTPSDPDFDIMENTEGKLQEPMSMKYNTSWDWLMPVVEKCYDIDPKIDGINGPHENIVGDITCALLEVDIEETYEAVVNFINWYNQNK